MTYTLHIGDIPSHIDWGREVAVDTETMGLKLHRDRLCLVQLSSGDGHAHLVQLTNDSYAQAVNLKALLSNPAIIKIFHYARFDLAAICHYLNVEARPIFCTKVAARLSRTFTDRHGLKDLCKELLGVEISKQQQTSDWGRNELTHEQMIYAANDVLHLHHLKLKLTELLHREDRYNLAEACFSFLPTVAKLDLLHGEEIDILKYGN